MGRIQVILPMVPFPRGNFRSSTQKDLVGNFLGRWNRSGFHLLPSNCKLDLLSRCSIAGLEYSVDCRIDDHVRLFLVVFSAIFEAVHNIF